MNLTHQISQTPMLPRQINADLANEKNVILMRKIREGYNKRSFSSIRDSITLQLQKRGCTLYELQVSCKLSRYTARRHLDWMLNVGACQKRQVEYKNKSVTIYEISK